MKKFLMFIFTTTLVAIGTSNTVTEAGSNNYYETIKRGR